MYSISSTTIIWRNPHSARKLGHHEHIFVKDGEIHLNGFRYLRWHTAKSRLASLKESNFRAFCSLWLMGRMSYVFCLFLLFVHEVPANFVETAKRATLRRQSGENSDCNNSVLVLCGLFNCIIIHAILALIACVFCEESPNAKFDLFPDFSKFCGFFTKQLLAFISFRGFFTT